MINSIVINALSSLNTPVSFQKYSGSATTYITFFEYLGQGESFADNEEKSTGHYIQVDIWSLSDYSTLVNSVLTAMKTAGFKRISEADLYENDTKIYHKPIRFFYLENQN